MASKVMRRRLLAAVLAMAMIPVSATAQSKVDRGNGSFFNKPGATSEQLVPDTTQCTATAEGADSQISAINVVAAGLGGIIGGAFAGKRLKRVNVENCMLIRGWRLYAMTREEGAAWKALRDDERDRQLTTLISDTSPTRGTLLREWRNDYAEPVLWQKN
jgi:hypothetical protein